MTMRTIGPLDEEDWDRLMAELEKGPTEAQKKILEEARKVGELYRDQELD